MKSRPANASGALGSNPPLVDTSNDRKSPPYNVNRGMGDRTIVADEEGEEEGEIHSESEETNLNAPNNTLQKRSLQEASANQPGSSSYTDPPSKYFRTAQLESDSEGFGDLECLLNSDGDGDDRENEAAFAEKRRLERKRALDLIVKEQITKDCGSLKTSALATPYTENHVLYSQDISKVPALSNEQRYPEISHEPAETSTGCVFDLNNDDHNNTVDADDDLFAYGTPSPLHHHQPRAQPATGLSRTTQQKSVASTFHAHHLSDNFDDHEGYYRSQIGELLNGQYLVLGSLGKGVFSSVLKCKDIKDPAECIVAIKVIRSNEHMEKAGLLERALLEAVAKRDIKKVGHVISFHGSFRHSNHLCLIFEGMLMNLRELLKKFGKHTGLSLAAVRSYGHQLLLGLQLLKKSGILHADLKPDNILVSENKRVIKIADLGSALLASQTEVAPLLVSRFYRPPEVMLGANYSYPLDLWSAACTLFELYTSEILFPGETNNQMLKLMMDLKGKPSTKFIKSGALRADHFDADYNFLYQDHERLTNRELVRIMAHIPSTTSVSARLPAAHKVAKEDVRPQAQFADLMEKCLVIDPAKRISLEDALAHPFFKIPS